MEHLENLIVEISLDTLVVKFTCKAIDFVTICHKNSMYRMMEELASYINNTHNKGCFFTLA